MNVAKMKGIMMREINLYLQDQAIVRLARGYDSRTMVYAPMFMFLVFTVLAGFLLGLLTYFFSLDEYLMLWQLNVSFGLVALLIFAYQKNIEKKSLLNLGLISEHAVPEYVLGCVVGLLMFSAVVLMIALSGVSTTSYAGGGSLTYWIFLTSGWMIQSFTEELGIRGWFMLKLTNRFPAMQSVFFSALLFTILHLTNPGSNPIALFNLLLCGIFLGLMVFFHGNIYLASGFHFVWNMAQGNIYGYPVSGNPFEHSVFVTQVWGDPWLHGGTFGPEGSLYTSILFLAGILFYYRRLKRRALLEVSFM